MNGPFDATVFTLTGSQLREVAEEYLSAVLGYDGEGQIAQFWPVAAEVLTRRAH